MGRISHHIPIHLGKKLKRIRTDLGFSQNEMLKNINLKLEKHKGGILKRLEISKENKLTRSSISGYELGTRMPPYYVVMAYAEAANVYLEVLYDDRVEFISFVKMPYKEKSKGERNLFVLEWDDDPIFDDPIFVKTDEEIDLEIDSARDKNNVERSLKIESGGVFELA